MNTKKYFVTLASLLLLTACASVADVAKTDDQSDKPEVLSAEQIKKQEETQNLLGLQEELNKIVLTGDVSACSALAMDQFKQSCEANILGNLAVKDSSAEKCASASSDDIKKRCEFLFSEDQKLKAANSATVDEKTGSPEKSAEDQKVPVNK